MREGKTAIRHRDADRLLAEVQPGERLAAFQRGRYIVYLKGTFPADLTLEGLKIVVDCAHGAAYKTAPEVFRELGADVIALGVRPDGTNINDGAGALHPERMQEAVVENRAHLGIALDGDADRVIVVDEQGRTIDGDAVMAICARELNPNVKVVLRMFDADLARRVEKGFGIHTAYSTSALAAPIFATAAMRFQVKHSFYVGDVLLNLAEFTIEAGAPIEGWTVQQLEKEADASVVTHHRDGGTEIHPELQQKLCAGDKILMLATIETLGRIATMSAKRGK